MPPGNDTKKPTRDQSNKRSRKSAAHQSDLSGVCYDEAGQAWLAMWSEGDGSGANKRVAKRFSIPALGFANAKSQAEAARLEAVAQGAAIIVPSLKDRPIPTDPAQLKSQIKGVNWDSNGKVWTVSWTGIDTGKRTSMKFSVCKHGFEDAKEMAEQFRRDLEDHGMVATARRDGTLQALMRNRDEDFEPSPEDLRSIPGVTYDRVRKIWKARWMATDGKRPNRTWGTAMYGFHEAKRLAEEARTAEVEAGARNNLSTKGKQSNGPAEHQSGVKGVTWTGGSGHDCWVASWSDATTGKRHHKTFAALQYGFEQAKELAITARKAAKEREEARLTRRKGTKAAHQSDMRGKLLQKDGGGLSKEHVMTPP